jgi:hypothetical protein
MLNKITICFTPGKVLMYNFDGNLSLKFSLNKSEIKTMKGRKEI